MDRVAGHGPGDLRGGAALRQKLRPALDLGALRGVRVSELGIRFLFGFAISVAAALLAERFGPRLGGMFLGFPAILPASLTLIEEKHRSQHLAGSNAIGAILGAAALIGFALVAVPLLVRLPLLLALLIATLAWLLIGVGLYFAVVQLRPVERLVRPPSKQ